MKTYVVTYYTKYDGEEQEAKHILDAKNAKDAVDKTRQFVKSQLNHHAFRPTAKPLMTKREQEMRDLICQIVLRAESLGIRKGTRITALMDIGKAAEHYALRLRDLLAADDLSFTYDFAGIQSHINRISGAFDDTFLPRFAGKKESA